jgi:RES domain-containing protein
VPVAFRIVKGRHRRTAFDGEGARVAGGRWNQPGDAILYASGSLALAAIETFVHLGEDGLHISFVYFRLEILDDLPIERLRKPPAQWRAEPAGATSMRRGSSWIRNGRTAILAVPSVILPSETNYLLNPNHPEFARIRIGRPQRFVFDPRMWK